MLDSSAQAQKQLSSLLQHHSVQPQLWCQICVCPCCAEVVEYACNLAVDLRGEFIENVSSGMDTYSIRQPLGVCTSPCIGSYIKQQAEAISHAHMACPHAGAMRERLPFTVG